MSVPASVLAVLASGAPANAVVFAHGDATLEVLRERQAELHDKSMEIVAAAEAEKRDMTVDEGQQVDELTAEFERIGNEIARRERINAQGAKLTAPAGRKTDAEAIVNLGDAERPKAAKAEPIVVNPRDKGNGGFRSFGDFAQAVMHANPRMGKEPDARLIRNATASTYASEGVGADGGFAVPPDFRAEIASKVFGEATLLGRTDRQVSSGNSFTMPTDMTTPWGTSGVQSYWTGESDAITQSKPALQNVTVKLNKLAALVPVTEELMEDAPALDGYLRRKVPEAMDFKISNSLIRGTGAGQPLGILNSPALVTVGAESGQTTDTINATNIAKMWARMPGNSRSSAVWLIAPDAEPQLSLMTIGQMPVYLPPGGMSQAPYGTLYGRPVIPHQVCETIGDLGDIFLVDWNQYMTVTKTGGMRTDVSIHLWFDQDIVAYRFTIRLGGQPWWSAYTTPRDGTSYMSPYITLQGR